MATKMTHLLFFLTSFVFGTMFFSKCQFCCDFFLKELGFFRQHFFNISQPLDAFLRRRGLVFLPASKKLRYKTHLDRI